MSLKDCFGKIRIDADDKRDIWAAKGRLNGDEQAAVQSYIDGLVADIEDARAQLIAQGFEVALPDVAPAVPKPAPRPTPRPAPKPQSTALSNVSQQKQDRAALLRARIAERLRNQTNVGVDPALLQDAIELAGIYIESGYRRFRDLLSQVAQDMGISEREAEPWVRAAYNQARDELELSDADVSDMDDARAVIAEARAVRSQEATNVPGSSPDLERTGGDATAGDADGATTVPDAAGATEPGTGGGARQADDGDGGRRAGAGVSEGGTAPVGTEGDRGVRGPQRAESGATARGVGRAGRSDSLNGAPALNLGAEDASGTATDAPSLEAKLTLQREAASVEVVPNDRANIDATLPLLYPEQRGDVAKVEARFAKPDGHGMLLTNGTGSGKTLSGLGVAYRMWQQGKRNILIVSESQPILNGWDRDAARLGLTVNRLRDTRDAGEGMVSTTYANLGDNPALSERDWDLFIFDEAHNLMQGKDGSPTKAVQNFRGLAKHPDHLWRLSQLRRADEWAKADALPENSNERAAAYRRLHDLQKADVEAMKGEPRPKTLFLSATPFAHDYTLDYAEGFLFNYDADGVTDSGSRQSGRNLFFVSNLGYRIRYHKLTQPEAAVDRGVFQRQLHDRLRKEGALSGRMLNSSTDYDRRFNIVADRKGEQIDQALKWWSDLDVKTNESSAKDQITKAIRRHFDYLKRLQLLEAIKARAIIPDVEKHLEMGRKVVIFHDYNVGGGSNPFGISVPDTDEARAMWARFMAENPYVQDLNFADYRAPREALTEQFGDRAAAYNGTISKGERGRLKNRFQDDNSGLDVLVVQSDAGSAGIDLHDTTGGHQRVLINIGMPTRPTRILQAEGRIRRIGSVSDAIYRYPFTGTSWERDAFARRIAEQSGTVENFALGSDARRIRESFIDAFEAADVYPPGMDGEGKGGVEIDGQAASLSAYDEAKSHYFGTAQVRANRNRRKGVDFFATPQPLGFKMAEWAGVREYESVLEPSAGDGAIARYLPANAERTVIEPSMELMSRARLFTGGAKHVESTFEDYYIGNKHDAVVMNPPFGSGGKTAMEHVKKAMRHVRPGGRVVALIPTGPAADKQFEAMRDSDEAKGFDFVADVSLPAVTFERAGTKVAARVVIFDRTDETRPTKRINLTGADDINTFFERLEGIDVPARPEPTMDAADRILDEQVERQENMPQTTSAPTIESADGYETFEFNDTRSGERKFGMQITERLGDRFREVNTLAKQKGGYYSKYQNKEAGAKRGFLFPSEAERQSFIDDLFKPTVSRDQRLTGPGPSAVFYSPLARALEGAKQASATPKDWKAIIGKLDGVKRAEVEWLGVEDWLDSQEGQVPREALVAFVQANEVVIEENVGGAVPEFDFEVQDGDYMEPDPEFIRANAEERIDEFIQDIADEEGIEPSEVDREEAMERAIEEEERSYEASGLGTYEAVLYDSENDIVFDGYFDAGDGEYDFYDEATGQGYRGDREGAIRWAENLASGRRSTAAGEPDFPSRFDEYTEDGGENYREILLRVPDLHTTGRNEPRMGREAASNMIVNEAARGRAMSEVRERYDDPRIGRRPFVQSSHFEQENIVVHARVKDRKDADGKRVLFVEEIQSDLASKWRENSESPEVTARRRELEQAREQANTEYDAAAGRIWPTLAKFQRDSNNSVWVYAPNGGDYPLRVPDNATSGYAQSWVNTGEVRNVLNNDAVAEEFRQGDGMGSTANEAFAIAVARSPELADAARKMLDDLKKRDDIQNDLLNLGTERSMDPSTPETPFLGENTYALMVKRLMRMAADEGYDAIAWTPGYMQAERWNAAAQSVVEGVRWGADAEVLQGQADDGKLVSLEMGSGMETIGFVVNDQGEIARSVYQAENLVGKKLSTLIGPGLAKQVMSEDSGSVSGQKIVFPDSGYAIAYDQQVKRSVEKLAKKHKAVVKVDRTLPDMVSDMRGDDSEIATLNPDDMSKWLIDRGYDAERVRSRVAAIMADEGYNDIGKRRSIMMIAERFDRPKMLDALLPPAEGRPVWRVDFTPELREAASRPMAILQKPSLSLSDSLMAEELAAEVMPELRKMLDRMGLSRVRIGYNTAADFQGRFQTNRLGHMDILIGRALDPAQTLYHEAIHALRVMNVFTPKEWATLERRALDDWMDRYDIRKRYPDLTLPEQMEEAIAEAFGDFGAKRRKEESSIVGDAFAKIKRLLKALRDVFRGKGMETPADVFGRVYAGEIGARKAGNTGVMQMAAEQRDAAGNLVEEQNLREAQEILRSIEDAETPDVSAMFEQFSKINRLKESMADALAEEPGGVELGSRNDVSAVVSPSLANPDGWRVTYFNNSGFLGHTEYDTKQRALREAITEGYDRLTPGAVRKMVQGLKRPTVTRDQRPRGMPAPPTTQGRMHHMNAMGNMPFVPDRRIHDAFRAGNGGLFDRWRLAKGAARDWVDRRRITIQDRMLPLLRAEEAIVAAGGSLTEDQRGYLAEETFSGKVGRHLFEIDEEVTKPILDIMSDAKDLTADDVGQWLYARHALERNARIGQINPEMPDGGSGMMDAEAQQILAEAAAGPHADALQKIGDLLDDLRERSISLRESSGLITPEEAQVWRTMYDHYVPLRGFADTDHSEAVLDITGLGRAYNVRGGESRRALGRGSEAFNPLIAMLTQAQEVAVRAEKNVVANAVYNMVKDHPAPMWKVVKPKQKRYFNRTTGMVETRVENPLQVALKPNQMAMKVNGQEVRIEFSDRRLAEALGQVGTDNLPSVMRPIQAFARYFSSINTMLNPVFTVVNASRDIITASINLGGLAGDKSGVIRKSAIKNWPKAFAGALGGMKGKENTEWQRYFKEFDKAGAKVSFWQIVEPEAGGVDFRKRLWLQQSPIAGSLSQFVQFSTRDNPILEVVERWNLAVDNAVRLAAFVEARKQGMTTSEAASLSKNLTVNFNRRGTATSFFNSLYPFFNAAIQGTQVLFRAASSRKVKGSIVAMFGLGLLSDLVNAMLSETDDDDELAYDKVPDWKHERNIVLMTGQTGLEETTIPLPYGYNVFWYAGVQAGKTMRGVKDPGEAIGGLFRAALGAFSPISAASPVEAVTPTILRPGWEMMRNEDWLGRPIRPENPYADYGPDAYKYYPSVSIWSKNLSDVLNRATGGNQLESGIIDISPEYIDHATGFLTGGMGRFVGDIADLTGKMAFGRIDEIERRDVPFYSTVQYKTGDWLDRDRYYRFRENVREARSAVKEAKDLGMRPSDRIRTLDGLYQAQLDAERKLRDKRATLKKVEARSDVDTTTQRRLREAIRESEAEIMLRFNRLYVDRMGPQGE